MSAFDGVSLIEGSRNLKEEHNSPNTDLDLTLTRPTVTHKQLSLPSNSLTTAHFHERVKYRFVNL